MPRRGWSPPREIEPKALVPVPWCGSYEVADSSPAWPIGQSDLRMRPLDDRWPPSLGRAAWGKLEFGLAWRRWLRHAIKVFAGPPFFEARAGAQPGHRFRAPGGSRGTRTATKQRQFEVRRASREPPGHWSICKQHGSGP